jgi:hypothetical protein
MLHGDDVMRLSTFIKHKYEKAGITITRAIQDDSLVRLTVPVGTPHLKFDLERLQRFQASGSDAPAPVPMYERD